MERINEFENEIIKSGSSEIKLSKKSKSNILSPISEHKNIIKRKFIAKETHEIIKGLDNENNKIINQYTLLSDIGSGSFSKVKLCIDLKTHMYYAGKCIKKKELAAKRKGFKKDADGRIIVSNYLKDALREIAILKKIECPNIVQLREIIHDDEKEKIWLFMDFAEKGTILDFDEDTERFSINKYYLLSDDGRDPFYSEDEIKDFLRGIIVGLEYCKLVLTLSFSVFIYQYI